ncbi:MucR family transcriptional regulator [Blastococcus sp. TBT05-19]|uniref:MucR family transcriptional regulator n=1 Tax=Blastococcus sp. TBT05-19 TaxID=2250581 RepID=UPI000DEB9BC4|nr:MucR family transcriptional regulator [Blastococcus sp. TBT05-19]RBY94122.1 MucR family transcriptional regulator [Blastococcus sp. TBT05-19]
MLHPVGPLPAAVYWRRRLVVLVLLLAVVGGLTWGTVWLLDRQAGGGEATATPAGPTELPALDRVVPSVAAVRTPEAPSSPAAAPSTPAAAAPQAPQAGGPCGDDVLVLEVRTPGQVAVGSKPTFQLAVGNAGSVPCVRALDKELQELVLVGAGGTRVWGSNDCFPESSDEPRTLAPGEVVVIDVVWGGLTSEPTCTAPRAAPAPGNYLLRGRLDTKVSADAPLTLQQG